MLRRLSLLSAVATSSVALALAGPGAALAAPDTPAPAFPDRTTQTVAPGDLLGVYHSALNALRTLGIEPFLYPAAAALCVDNTTLGMAPAVAGSIPGPWPKNTVQIPGLDLSAVKSGQAMFTFVPYGLGPDGPNTAGMHVAWVNLSTGRSGTAGMGPLSEVARGMIPAAVPPELRPAAEQAIQDFLFASLPMGGVRAVPVDTGRGTVLAAVFGTVQNGARSCHFLPTVGIATVP
ncbi:hypothetical protein OHA40_05605 [Nocardia sp. NBC_00508]|uniref:hypothetical protein n=1 Tax=Nocardia sp. NBC_00508 TaxID=2975992 RepID=UPI002E814742|nr:hypothetical protein [Nocardia sp. NBC_00508]WUD69725.1 hypothetical protein OHA40_05605 [Nocardia sp. NBC_00508]